MKRTSEGMAGPVYGSWDEAMADPDLDMSKPWYVVPDLGLPPGVHRVPADFVPGQWPDGWREIGYTTDDSAGRAAEQL